MDEEREKRTVSEPVVVVIDLGRSRAWCGRPYVGHPKGCPNFGRKPQCPPIVGLFEKMYQKKVRVVAVGMDFEEYLKQRKNKFPKLSDRGLRNPLYWQGHLRAELKKLVRENVEEGEEALLWPEAMGVDVTRTCKKVGIILEWPPKNWVYKVAVLAKRL